MRLKVLGSSSSGNCYLLEDDRECLILEAGIRYKEVQKALDYDVNKITGCLVSHEHGDHAKYAHEYLEHSVDVYASAGTWQATQITSHRAHSIRAYERFTIGGFDVIPFTAEHDAAEPLGFLINHPDMGTLLFATDTYYLKDRFTGLNHILIECNYSLDILDENTSNGLVHGAMHDRITTSHMELDTCKEFFAATDLSQVNTIVLLHLSAQNGNRTRFIDEIEGLTGKITHAAYKGVEIELNKTLF